MNCYIVGNGVWLVMRLGTMKSHRCEQGLTDQVQSYRITTAKLYETKKPLYTKYERNALIYKERGIKSICFLTKTNEGFCLHFFIWMLCEIQQQLQDLVFYVNLHENPSIQRDLISSVTKKKWTKIKFEESCVYLNVKCFVRGSEQLKKEKDEQKKKINNFTNRDIYFAATLEVFLIKVKMATKCSNSKKRSQESRFVCGQNRTVWVLLMFSF